jgi:hypothetical protein
MSAERWRIAFLVTPFLLAGACRHLPSAAPPRVTVSFVSSPFLAVTGSSAQARGDSDASGGGLLVIDSTSLRPVVVRTGTSTAAGISLISSFQGGRYHPETIRAIAGDSAVLLTTAGLIARGVQSTSGSMIMLDFQGATPEDLPRLVELFRAIANLAHARTRIPVAVVVPAGDTVSYPTDILSRIADLIVIRLSGEHRQGTPPGPLTTTEFIARAIGTRARVLGPNRLVGELPLYGFRWNSAGAAAPITFSDAQALVASEGGVFRRDQSSQFLTASGREGWTLWVPDARTVEAMIASVTRRGVTRIVLSGIEGADPAIPDRIAALR